jgi:hypothetical protein
MTDLLTEVVNFLQDNCENIYEAITLIDYTTMHVEQSVKIKFQPTTDTGNIDEVLNTPDLDENSKNYFELLRIFRTHGSKVSDVKLFLGKAKQVLKEDTYV